MTVPPRLAMLFAEQSFLCRIYSINKVVVVVVFVAAVFVFCLNLFVRIMHHRKNPKKLKAAK